MRMIMFKRLCMVLVIIFIVIYTLLLTLQLYKSNHEEKSTDKQYENMNQRLNDLIYNNKNLHKQQQILSNLIEVKNTKIEEIEKTLDILQGSLRETKNLIKQQAEKSSNSLTHPLSDKSIIAFNHANTWPSLETPFPMCDSTSVASKYILSYSLFGKKAEHIGRFIRDVHNESSYLEPYKKFTLRVYVDDNFSQKSRDAILQTHSRVQFCDIRKTPKYGDLSSVIGTVWRFLSMGDNTIKIFCSRDLDSPLIEREADAVLEWFKTDAIIHVMRDRRQHYLTIMGGMWCFRVEKNIQLARDLLDKIIIKARSTKSTREDQTIINKVVWPIVNTDSLQHDSYNCKNHVGSKPFPTKRKDYFVGCVRDCWVFAQEICPVECRPKDHEDWIYC